MNLSIIIISYKSLTNLENCLKHLGNKREILIIENSNEYKLKENIESKHKNCKVILNKENFGFGKASNIGIEKINTQFVLLLSTDILIKENQIDLIESEILKLNNSFALASPLSDDLIDFIKNNNFDKFLENKIIDPNNNDDSTKVDLIKGCSLIINLKKFEKQKVFDENFFFFFEEIDLCRRVKNSKESIYILNKIKIIHYSGKGVDPKLQSNYDDFRNWNFYWSRFYYYKKHYGYLFSFIKHISKLLRFFVNTIRFYPFSKDEFKKNKSRFLGLSCSMIGINSKLSNKILNK